MIVISNIYAMHSIYQTVLGALYLPLRTSDRGSERSGHASRVAQLVVAGGAWGRRCSTARRPRECILAAAVRSRGMRPSPAHVDVREWEADE